jgi:hypothetical protein
MTKERNFTDEETSRDNTPKRVGGGEGARFDSQSGEKTDPWDEAREKK